MIYSNFLSHYGVKGQRWGVRNGPPYPIEDKTLKKGTKLNSVSWISDSEAYKTHRKTLYTYNPNDEWDSKVYKGPFSVYKMRSVRAFMFEHQYEVVKDLKMPTKKERVDEFINLYTNNKRMVVKDLKHIQKIYKRLGYDKLPEKSGATKLNLKRLKTKEDYDNAYQLFNHTMENVGKYESAKVYSDIMAGKYDAMVDDNNQGIYNMAHDPIIVFRANEVLRTCGKERMLTVEEVNKNMDDVAAELSKYGIKVKL